ncbi:gas vesicle protein [Streptomyces solicathayae]|uniref:Gas vesicle protein n=1 Tax=Streptomyces solicathayae TaxID=3081768 RepID=A0ABZ0LLX0_9ACTN|nr:gas vesicle protein [Streptomyces sp. HUAS YS2]WOX20392.1 gas vesicle protein [Streptomyces sp. HUAS YS2]
MDASDSEGPSVARSLTPYGQQQSANLADILERVLDKGIVIVGDIRINLLDIELLTIKLRLLVASVDKAREIGIDWWEHDPALSSRAGHQQELKEENERLRAEVKSLRARSESRSELPEGPRSRRRRTSEADEQRAAPERRSRRRESDGKKTRARDESDAEAETEERQD